MNGQTQVTIYSVNNGHRVVIGPRFESDHSRRYSPTKASMNRLLSLGTLTGDWPVSVTWDFGTVWIDYVIEDATRDAWRQIHAGMSNDEWAEYHGPSALTQVEREELGNQLSEALS